MNDDAGRRAAKAVELRGLRRWRKILLPTMSIAVVVQALAYHRLLTTGAGWGASILSTAIGVVAVAWTGLSQRRIQLLEDELE